MTLSFSNLISMAFRTINNPREGAAEVLSLGVPRSALMTIIALVVVLSSLLALVTNLLVQAAGSEVPPGPFSDPIAIGAMQFALLLLMVFAIFWVGRSFGGTGSLEEAMLLVAWLQFIMVCIQVVQTLFFVIMPGVASLIGLLGFALFLWLLTNFVAVLHGFRSRSQVFVMIIVTSVAIVFAMSLVLIFLGVEVPTTGQI